MRKSVLFVVSLLMLLTTSTVSAQSFCSSGKIVDIQCGQTISGSTINGSSSFSSARYASCLESITSQTPFSANDVIYRFSVAQPTRVEVTLSGLSADLDLFIFKDCNDGSSCIQKSARVNNSSENVVFENLSGTYYIIVDGYNSTQKSDFTVSIKCGNTSNCETSPCANATSIQCGQTVTSNNTSSASRFNKACNYTGCYSGTSTYVGNDKVYRLDVAAGTSLLEIFLTGLSANLDVFVFQGNCNPGSCIATGLKTGVNAETILINNPSGTYYIVVDAPEEQKSNFTLSTKCSTSGINCNQAETLTCGQTYNFSTINGTNRMAYNNYGTCINDTDPVLNPYTGNDRLFKISVPAGRTLEITMSGLSADLDMFLFDVCDNVVVLNAPADQDGLKGCLARSFEPDNVDEKIVINNASGDYYLVVDAPTADRKSNFTLKINCQEPCPPALNADCNNVTFYYSGIREGGYVYTFIAKDNLPNGKWTVSNSSGTILQTQDIGKVALFRFPTLDTYTICYEYNDSNGCPVRCCKTICVVDPYKCNAISATRTNSGYTLNLAGYAASNIVEWKDDQSEQVLGTNTTSINIAVPNPGTCRNICAYVYNPSSKCYTICCIEVCTPACTPANNNCDNISFNYSGTNGALTYSFAVPANYPAGKWIATGGQYGSNIVTLSNSKTFSFTFPAAGKYKVGYEYTDGNGCLIQCFKTICVQNPNNCSLVNVQKSGNNFQLTLPNVTASNINEWRDTETNALVGTTTTSVTVPIPGINTCKIYTVQYFDAASGCYTICAVKVCGPTCAPADTNCSTISYTYNGSNGVLTHTFNVPVSLPEGTWVVTGGGSTDASRVISRSFIYTFPSAGTYSVCYTYKDANGCEIQCCRTVCVADPYNCNLVNVVKTNAGFTLSLPGVSANNIVQWRNQLTNTFVAVNQTSVNVPAPGLNSCVNYTVQYFDPASNCYRICGVTVCGPTCAPADNNCSTISYTYNGSNGVLTHTFNVPVSLPEGTWVVTGGGSTDASRVISRSFIYTFPSAGTYSVCYTYKDANGCEIQCCRTVCVADPYNCNLVNVVKTNAGFTLSLPGVSANNIVQWRNQLTNTFVAVNQTSVNVPAPGLNSCVNYTVQYFDPASNCYRICGVTVCGPTCAPADNNCSTISYTYNGSNGVLTHTFNVPVSLPEGTWVVTGGGSTDASRVISRSFIYTFPSAGTYSVCYTYKDANGCEIQCCRTVCVADPYNCNLVNVVKTNAGFTLSLPGVSANNIVQWRNQQTNTFVAVNQTSVNVPQPALNACTNYTVQYFDPASNCYRICGVTVCGPTCAPADENCTNVSFTYAGSDGSLRYSLIATQNLPIGTWTATGGALGNSEATIGQDRAINYTFPASGVYTVCYKYRDSNGCEIKCCKTICVVDPFACNRITANKVNNNFNLSISGINAGNIIQWYDSQTGTVIATNATNISVGLPPANTCRVISVLYFDTANKCYAICSIKICGTTCPGADNNCNNITFDYNGVNGSLLYGFSVPSSVSNSGTWVATGGSFGNVEFVLGQGRNINYTFSTAGTYKICYRYTNAEGCLIQCCKTICITDPFGCTNLLVTPNQNSYIVSLTGYPTNAISQWTDEDSNQTIAASVSSVALPSPAPGQCRRISVLLFDAATNCYSICGKTICEPEHPCGSVSNIVATCSGSLLDLSFTLKNNTGNANVDAQYIVVSPAGIAFEDCTNVKTIENASLGNQNVKLQLRSCTTPLKAGNVVTIYVALIDNTANCDLYCPLTPITFVIPECQSCLSQARVVSCPTVYNPVCGCNNITYNNSCEAEREGVTKWSPGVCPGSNVANSNNSAAQIVAPTTPNYELSNSPNPFSGSTVIRFNLPENMDATVTVMDMDGKVVFEESGLFVAGWNEVNFEETIDLSSGMYFYRLQTTEQVMTKTMVLTKE